MQPITFLLLFTPFLKSVMGASSYGDAYGIYVPLLFAAMGIFSGMFAGFALVAAIRQGVIGRFRVTPLSRAGLLLGRELVFVVLTGFQAVVVVVVALIFGLRVPPVNLLLALVLPRPTETPYCASPRRHPDGFNTLQRVIQNRPRQAGTDPAE